MSEITYLNGRIKCAENENGCHEVIGNNSISNGYPRFKYKGATYNASRLVYMVEILGMDELERNVLILHSCDNRKCCNPNHLFIGSHLDNAKDRDSKGRASVGEKHSSIVKLTTSRGEIHPDAKLTEKDVVLIRNCYKTKLKTQKELADIFGVNQSRISSIVNYKTWTHV